MQLNSPRNHSSYCEYTIQMRANYLWQPLHVIETRFSFFFKKTSRYIRDEILGGRRNIPAVWCRTLDQSGRLIRRGSGDVRVVREVFH